MGRKDRQRWKWTIDSWRTHSRHTTLRFGVMIPSYYWEKAMKKRNDVKEFDEIGLVPFWWDVQDSDSVFPVDSFGKYEKYIEILCIYIYIQSYFAAWFLERHWAWLLSRWSSFKVLGMYFDLRPRDIQGMYMHDLPSSIKSISKIIYTMCVCDWSACSLTS